MYNPTELYGCKSAFIPGISTATAEEASILVNADNYARAEAAFQFESMFKRSGGINELAHVRQPIPLDRQRNMQMNRDTIYSSAVVDISTGASVSFPNSGDRYMSIAIVNEDNYTTAVYHGGEAIDLRYQRVLAVDAGWESVALVGIHCLIVTTLATLLVSTK